MNNGGVESKRGNGKKLVSRKAGADEFAYAVARVAVAQICESAGFQGLKESALDSLTEVAIWYLRNLAKTASFSASLAGRTECSAFDIIRGLEDLGSSQGFLGASEIHGCLACSGTVREIIEYVGSAEEIPYAQPVPQFPVTRSRRMIPSFLQMNETPPSKHMPAWLPAFPDPHTYIHTPTWNERDTDPRADKIEQAKQRRKAERSLLSLQQRLASNSCEGTLALVVKQQDVKGTQMVHENPFFVAPLQPGEKDVSVVELPAKLSNDAVGEGHVSVLQAFAPAIEVKGGFCDNGNGTAFAPANEVKGGFCDNGNGDRKFVPDKRHAISFKLRSGKKLAGESLDLSLKNKDGRPVTWIARDDERDDKKKRAEYILRQSMENPLDLMQL